MQWAKIEASIRAQLVWVYCDHFLGKLGQGRGSEIHSKDETVVEDKAMWQELGTCRRPEFPLGVWGRCWGVVAGFAFSPSLPAASASVDPPWLQTGQERKGEHGDEVRCGPKRS